MQTLQENRPLRVGVLAGIAAAVVLQVLFGAYVHYSFEGRYYGPLLIAEYFGVPRREAAVGVRPVVVWPGRGWDGQFYYFQSNDLFARRDARLHSDYAPYRYQRIGAPLLARAAAQLLGYRVTPPGLYHAVQILATALGFGVLAGWLAANGLSPWYALAWLGAAGPVHALFHGLPDSVGDAFFILSFCALTARRLGLYALAATLLVLVREGYVVFPAAVFLLTVVQRINWETSLSRRLALTALPGVVMVAWTAYLVWRLGGNPLSPNRNTPGLVDLPFAAFGRQLLTDWANGNFLEVKWKILSAASLALVLVLALRFARREAAVACAVPYLVLTTSLGPVIWENYTGYPKASGTVLVLGVFLLPLTRSTLLRFALAANLLMGLDFHFHTKIQYAPLYSARHAQEYAALSHGRQGVPPSPVGDGVNGKVTDFRSSVRGPAETTLPYRRYRGVWEPVHRGVLPVKVTATNRSDTPWYAHPRHGPLAVSVGYILTDPDGKAVDGRVPLERTIRPGESRDFVVDIPDTRLLQPGKYALLFGMVQDGFDWFHAADPAFASRYEVVVE